MSDVCVMIQDISYDYEVVKKTIDDGFRKMRMDENGIGSEGWNPLGEIINEGDTVLVKPNLVMDRNRGKGG